MLQEVSTIGVDEQPLDFSVSSPSQTAERDLPIKPLKEGWFLQYVLDSLREDFVVSSLDIAFQMPGYTNESVTTELPMQEPVLTSPRVSYRDYESVRAYLDAYPEIEAFLEEAGPGLVRRFGSSVEVVLEVISYPQESAYSELVGWIQSTDAVSEGLEKLERFEDEWLFEQLTRVGNRFNFNIEFK
jgi:hypothetical protein